MMADKDPFITQDEQTKRPHYNSRGADKDPFNTHMTGIQKTQS